MIRSYASRTGTRRNLAALRAAGWGLFVSATGVHRHEGFPFIIDNGAWTYFRRGEPWDPAPFVKVVESMAGDQLCQGIVAPDIVCGGRASLELTLAWMDFCGEFLRLDGKPITYMPVQPGIPPAEVRRFLCPEIGVFVGGDSDWKEATCGMWAELAHERRAPCHVGRVNSGRRLAICKRAKVDSFDGSGPSRFEKALHEMEAALAVAVQVGLVLRVWVEIYVDGDQEHFDLIVDATYAAASIVLAALRCGLVGDVIEIQTDAGIYRRLGQHDFRFDTWDWIVAAGSAGFHYLDLTAQEQ